MASNTRNEKTRNERYLIMKHDDKKGDVVSYGKNLIKKINDEQLLSDVVSENCLKSDADFRDLISKLDKAGYSVYQLTRL